VPLCFGPVRSGRRGIVEVDDPSSVVRLRLDLYPFRSFGLCSLGGAGPLRGGLGEVGIVIIAVRLEGVEIVNSTGGGGRDEGRRFGKAGVVTLAFKSMTGLDGRD
jgi:hypothetical protein